MSAIRTHGLAKTYPGADSGAVNGLDLEIPTGVVYCLLGRNGAGKSTTIRMLTTLLPPTAGTAEVLGVPLTDVRRLRPLIGVALQEVALDPWLSAREQLEFGLALAGWARTARRGRVDALIERFGLEAVQRKRIGTLSGGMRRRVDVALAVSHDPRLLFLDEPSSGLDIEGKDELWRVISGLRDEGRTVVLTTHDMEEAMALADHVGIIKAGRLIASGPAAELTRARGARARLTTPWPVSAEASTGLRAAGFPVTTDGDRALTVELPAANAREIARLTAELRSAGLADAELRIDTTSLRDAFLEATR
ncbi:ABC transporter ATP-binding protein [Nocardia sp. CDC159]|uniref:ABC transporter ATP-binding protein n=1 Tax=Nocardia pulmonis TaxID=2951408 RepID=A0A9X2E2N9_9NOCA|nr:MULTISPECIES: ABC transporter ATP-binding protein [Nocardia]MCM6772535.1 ABC transporter ATP-binding protein [Nocardia pulmonis]MCM6784807.1 ABC transporter ATP-binding protein [Nocardia sp. CDC159]